MKLCKEICSYVELEFDNFRTRELLKNKIDIFYDNFKIRFYNEIYSYFNFTENKTLRKIFSKNELKFMAREGRNFIHFLYDFYIKNEFSSIENSDEVEKMIHAYCAKYMKEV